MLTASGVRLNVGSTDSLFAALRFREFSRLDLRQHAYLDYTGSALYADRQLRAHQALLDDGIFGNPHSENEASQASTRLVEHARSLVLSFLDADPNEYVVIFTANTSAAIKLVGESYPFAPQGALVLSADNHNSVHGMRQFAERAGATVHYIPLDESLRLRSPIEVLSAASTGHTASRLLAFPPQSNFSGVKHPLSLVQEAQQHGFDVLLDAAAFVPTNALSLRTVCADYVALSFYKIFGYPTGVGALVARKSALAKLRRPWFAGGTVEFASVQNRLHRLRDFEPGFEDGTPNFLGIAGLAPGFELISEIGMARLNAHVTQLTEHLLLSLQELTHFNGHPLIELYGPSAIENRGATVAFNVLDASGRHVPFAEIETRARDRGVSLRGGCFCNPGASEAAFRFPSARAARCLRSSVAGPFSVAKFAECLGGNLAVGAVRASLGLANNAADVQRAVNVIAEFRS